MNQSVRMLRLPEVLRKTALSRSQIYRLIGEGDFPRQVQLGKRAAGWIENEIDEWLLGCVARSRCPTE